MFEGGNSMKWSKIFIYLFIVAVVGTMSYFITTYIVNGKNAEESSIAEQIEQKQSSNGMRENVEGTENELTKSDVNGAVAIKTTLLVEKSNKNQVVFEVVMNTHSVDMLQYDLPKLASISFGTSINTSGTFKWEPASNDSHHMMGYLKWDGAMDKNYQNINLDLKNIDNIPSRIFSWKKSNITDQILNK
jgi:hypothetical protein